MHKRHSARKERNWWGGDSPQGIIMLEKNSLMHKSIEPGAFDFCVIKRSGEQRQFDPEKIWNALSKAAASVDQEFLNLYEINKITTAVTEKCRSLGRPCSVEEIQDSVEDMLMDMGKKAIARHYITYRYKRALLRQKNTTDDSILSLINCENEEVKEENSNKNPVVNAVQRDYMAGEVSKDLSRRLLVPSHIMQAHEEGIIHFHDMDYFAQRMYNCCLVNLKDMLENGTVISGTRIEKPHSFSTACNIATQIIAQIASNQYGGQTITLSHLAPFVDVSRQSLRKQVKLEFDQLGLQVDESVIFEAAELRLRKEIEKGVQTIQYQIITLMTTNGQAPFLTVSMYLGEVADPAVKKDLAMVIEEVLRQRIQGVKNEKGVWITPAFPKLIYVLEKDNIQPGAPFYALTELAALCTAKRMVPDYISEKIMKQLKVDAEGKGQCYPAMGCRSFLTPYINAQGQSQYYGRFNQGVVTINLVDTACSSGGDEGAFWRIFEERLELCHEALRIRHKRLLGTKSDCAPILWQHGAIARLKAGEVIDHLLYGGYSTISLGYAGLYECVLYMKKQSHTTAQGKEFGLRIMEYMNEKCRQWKEAENIDYSVYGTPIESTTYKFAKCLQKRFGKISGVTDRPYISNSYHVCVREKIDAFEKLTLEADFQRLSPGGAISYVEVPDLQRNIPAVMALIRHIYDHIMYAELNTKSDYCQVCGWDGEIQIIEQEGRIFWRCPNCGNTDQAKMNVARRTCGYIGTQFWGFGRTKEISDRVLHL